MNRPLVAVAAGLLVAVAPAAIGAAPTPAAALTPGSRYVSLGSSYAAGPGVGAPDPESGGCARSQSNYARRIAARRKLRLVDVACSGATTANILDHGQHGFPAQVEAVTADTRLVTILIGGNDIGYIGNLAGLTCRDAGGPACHVLDPQEVERRLAALPASLDRVILAVQRRAPAARIVLVGYLPAIPARGPGTCGALPLTPANATRMRGVAIRLAQAIGGAADRHGVGVVRTASIGAGHDACSPRPYVAGYRPARNPGWPSPVAYHPTQDGMDRVAQALDQAIDRAGDVAR